MYEKAKAIVIEKPRQAQVKEIPVAPVDDETIVVKTKFSGIENPADNQSTTTTDESPTLGIGGVGGAIVLTSLLLARRARRANAT